MHIKCLHNNTCTAKPTKDYRGKHLRNDFQQHLPSPLNSRKIKQHYIHKSANSMYLAWFKVAIIKRLPVIQMPQGKGKTA